MSNRKYIRLADGYHDRSPYNPYQSSGKYSSKQSSSVSEGRPERVSNINGGTGSRSNSPRSRHSNMSPRSHRVKSSYSKTRELSKRGSSSSPVDTVSHHSSSASDRMLKVDSISTDDSFPWSQHTSSSGKTYYYNCKTEKSQWEKPKEWLEREYRLGREKKKREAKEKTDHSRDNVHSNQAMSTKGSSRESSREQSSSTKRDGSTGSVERDRAAYLREETHRPDLLPARSDSTVSPSGSLQDVSPPVTPATMSIQNSSPRVTVSPIITTRSPVMLSHQQSPIVQNQSPVHPNAQRQLATHLCNSSTPPPPPPPIAPHTSSAHIVTGGYTSSYTGIPAQNSAQVNAINSSAKLTENQSFNGIHALSQSQLHPLQQATLLQAQFHGASNARAVAPGVLSASSPGAVQPHFQPVKQSSSTRASPVPFNVHPYPRVSSTVQLSSVATQKASLVYAPPQSANIQDFAPLFNRGLISHTTGWPSEPMEKQAQRSLDDTLSLSLANHRLKADLVPLNFHHNLTAMRMGVGAKRIEFLRQQTRKLETSDSIS